MNLFKSISIYTFSNLSKQAVGFVLLPIITYYLSQEQNGNLSLITALVSLIGPLILLSAHGAINLEFFRKDQGADNFSSYVSSALVNPIWATLLVTFILAILSPYAMVWLDIEAKWFVLIAALSFANAIPNVTSTLFQARKMPIHHSVYNISLTVIDLLLSILLIAGLSLNWEGRLWAMLASKLSFSIIGFYLLWRGGFITKAIEKKYVQNALFYGLPLIPHVMSGSVMDLSDRIFISTMVSKEELGIYDIGYKIGSIVLILQASILMAWTPFFYEKMKQINWRNKIYIISVSYLIMIGMIIACLGLWLVAPLIFDWFIDDKFEDGIRYVIWVGIAYVFLAFYKMVAGYIFYLKKNRLLSYIAVLNIIINLVLNYFLIKNYGAMGAAYATVISYFLLFVVTAIISHRLYPMPWFNFKEVFLFLKMKYLNKEIF